MLAMGFADAIEAILSRTPREADGVVLIPERCTLWPPIWISDMPEPSRLDIIEIKLAHLEQSLQELGETVMRQQRDIDVLSAHNRALREQLKVFESGGASAQGFETPPHY